MLNLQSKEKSGVMDNPKTWTGARIRSLRKRLGMSATEFGVALGFAKTHCKITIHRHERGLRTPSPQTIMLMQQMEEKLPDLR